jgi:proteasome lid subunit RPN8/RPN11
MSIAVPEAELEKIRAHGAADYPHECCGVLLGMERNGTKVVREARDLPNARRDSRRNRFLITPDDYRACDRYAQERGLEILGFYHSHPDHPARPSEYDREHAWPWMSYIIVSVEQGRPARLTSWVLAEDRSQFQEETVEICQPK